LQISDLYDVVKRDAVKRRTKENTKRAAFNARLKKKGVSAEEYAKRHRPLLREVDDDDEVTEADPADTNQRLLQMGVKNSTKRKNLRQRANRRAHRWRSLAVHLWEDGMPDELTGERTPRLLEMPPVDEPIADAHDEEEQRRHEDEEEESDDDEEQ
jgi:hypothetical protein